MDLSELDEVYDTYQATVVEYNWFRNRRFIAVYMCLYMMYVWLLFRLRVGWRAPLHGLDLMAMMISSHFYEIYYRRSVGEI